MDIRETGLLIPLRPVTGKTSARPGKHRGMKDAAGAGLTRGHKPSLLTFAVSEPVSPLPKLRMIRCSSWSLGRFHGPSDYSHSRGRWQVAGDSHFFLNGKYPEPSSNPCSAPSSKSFCFSALPFSCFPGTGSLLGDGGCSLPGTDILHLMSYVGMIRIAGLHLLMPFLPLSCLVCPLLTGVACFLSHAALLIPALSSSSHPLTPSQT